MASNTSYGDWMRPMPEAIRNIGIPLTIAGMGVLTCTLLVSMASVVAAIAILVVGMEGVILVLAIRDREHPQHGGPRRGETHRGMAAQRKWRNLYRSACSRRSTAWPCCRASSPGGPDSAPDGLGRVLSLVRHAHTGEYSLLLGHASRRARASPTTAFGGLVRVASWAELSGMRSPPRPASPNWP